MDSHCGASTQSVHTAHDHYRNTILTLVLRAYLACQHSSLTYISHIANPPLHYMICPKQYQKDLSLCTTMLLENHDDAKATE